MGFGNFLGQVTKSCVRVVTLPVSVAKDVVTLGGALTDEESATAKHLNDIVEDIQDIPDSID